MLRTVCLGLLGLTAVACNSLGRKGKDPGSDVKAVADTVYLGMGYDSDSFQTRDACIVGTERLEQQPQIDWNFKKIENWETAKREMGYSVEGEYTYGIAKVTAKSSFTRNMQDTDVTTSYLLVADYLGVTKFLVNGELPANIISRFESGEVGQGTVRRRCGNRYVSQVDAGGMLRVMVKFRFSNKTVKQNFNFTASVKAGLNSVTATTDIMSEDELKNSSAEIHIHQEGGDLGNLGQILDPSAVVECSLDRWDQCQNMIKKIMEYSVNTFPADVKAGNARLFSYKTTPYFDIDFAPLPDEVQAKRMATMIEMEKQDYDIIKIQYLLKDRENHTIDDRKRELENLRALLNRNVSKLTTNLLSCVEFPNDAVRCVTVDALKLEPYDQARLILGSQRIVGPSLGGNGGNAFSQVCRNFMVGAQGTFGDVIDQLAVVCDDGRLLSTAARNQANRYYNTSCPAGQVVTGVRGNRGSKDAIGTLIFVCKDLAAMRAQSPTPAGSEITIRGGAIPFTWDCPPGLAVIGLEGRSDKYVNAISLICSSY